MSPSFSTLPIAKRRPFGEKASARGLISLETRSNLCRPEAMSHTVALCGPAAWRNPETIRFLLSGETICQLQPCGTLKTAAGWRGAVLQILTSSGEADTMDFPSGAKTAETWPLWGRRQSPSSFRDEM